MMSISNLFSTELGLGLVFCCVNIVQSVYPCSS